MTPHVERLLRERRAYDLETVWERSRAAQSRFRHVFRSPNTLRAVRFGEDLLRARSLSRRVLEIGCGNGALAQDLFEHGAAYVLGLDVSERFLAEARRRAVPGRLEFENRDITEPLSGRFDVICGYSVLHHIDYRLVVDRLYEENLEPGGLLLFREPLGSNLLSRIWWLVGRSAHTPDERPFRRCDLGWLGRRFPGFRMLGVNYLSFPAGIVSSLVCRRPDNVLLRWADGADCWLHEHAPWLRYRFRHSVLIIEKPQAGSSSQGAR